MPITAYPNNSDYEQAIKKAKKSRTNIFKTIGNVEFIPSKTGSFQMYSYGAGQFAVVFKGKINKKKRAIRCFVSSEQDAKHRYEEISSYLDKKKPFWYSKVNFIDKEIRINRKYYPVLIMDWVEGQTLNDFISDNKNDKNILSNLQTAIIELSKNLEKNKIGHGDIQCGNVFCTIKAGKIHLSLVDYDNLYVPSLEKLGSTEKGLSQFQHPLRSEKDYNHKIDRFSFWVCLTALEAIKYNPSLWDQSNDMLFDGKDFINPSNSNLFNQLINHNSTITKKYAQTLKNFCHLESINKITKPSFLDEKTKIKKIEKKSVNSVTKKADKSDTKKTAKSKGTSTNKGKGVDWLVNQKMGKKSKNETSKKRKKIDSVSSKIKKVDSIKSTKKDYSKKDYSPTKPKKDSSKKIGIAVAVVAAIVIIFLFMGGGSWTDEDQALWKEQCSYIGNDKFCDCTLDHLMDNYSSYDDAMGEDFGYQAGYDAGEACSEFMFEY